MVNPIVKKEEEVKETVAAPVTQETVMTPTPVVKETVTINKETLDDLMNRLKRVEQAADKSRLAKFDEANKGKLIRQYRIRTFGGKVVTSWSDMIDNTVEKDVNGKWKEDQTVELTYEDKTKEVMPYVIWDRNLKRIDSELISETKVGDDVIFKLRTEDGNEYELNNKFVN